MVAVRKVGSFATLRPFSLARILTLTAACKHHNAISISRGNASKLTEGNSVIHNYLLYI